MSPRTRAIIIPAVIGLMLGVCGCGSASGPGGTTVKEIIEASPTIDTETVTVTETRYIADGGEDYGVGLNPGGSCLGSSSASAIFFGVGRFDCRLHLTAADELAQFSFGDFPVELSVQSNSSGEPVSVPCTAEEDDNDVGYWRCSPAFSVYP